MYGSLNATGAVYLVPARAAAKPTAAPTKAIRNPATNVEGAKRRRLSFETIETESGGCVAARAACPSEPSAHVRQTFGRRRRETLGRAAGEVSGAAGGPVATIEAPSLAPGAGSPLSVAPVAGIESEQVCRTRHSRMPQSAAADPALWLLILKLHMTMPEPTLGSSPSTFVSFLSAGRRDQRGAAVPLRCPAACLRSRDRGGCHYHGAQRRRAQGRSFVCHAPQETSSPCVYMHNACDAANQQLQHLLLCPLLAAAFEECVRAST